MIVEDEIRAKGLGVALEGSIHDQEDLVHTAEPIAYDALQVRYYRARFESCRDGVWFSIALNAILIGCIAWMVWRS